jgi:hypothetical protein
MKFRITYARRAYTDETKEFDQFKSNGWGVEDLFGLSQGPEIYILMTDDDGKHRCFFVTEITEHNLDVKSDVYNIPPIRIVKCNDCANPQKTESPMPDMSMDTP